jgi:hypothetical protein
LLRAFYEVFPQGMTFANLDTGDFIMYGSDSPIVFDFEQMEKRMNEPKIKAALNYHEIYSATDLMWYFALSREQALAASMDVPANTDTNILSEVRLSAIDKDPTDEEDPYDFLKSIYSFNLRPYFGEDAVQKLYEIGTYYLSEWNEPGLAQHVADQLRELDLVKARGIEYEMHWHRFEFDEASAMFERHDQWPDRTYAQQALLLADRGDYDEALAVVSRITKEGMRRSMSARLLFKQGRYDELVALQPKYNNEKLWRLSALAQKDLITAGIALHALTQTVTPSLLQLRILASYYGAVNDAQQLDRVARLIVEQQDKAVTFIQSLLEEAVDEGQVERAQALLARLDQRNPADDYELNRLRKKVAQLSSKQI